MTLQAAKHTHYRTCNLCEAMCGIVIETENNQIVSIKGDQDDPFSKGHICPKATALQDIYEDPNRLKYPVRRTADGWEQITWDEAFDAVVAGIKAVQAQHGRDAVGIYQGNPNVHNLGSMLFSPPFVRTLRTKNRFSATSVDQLPHHFAAYFMFGHQLLLPVPDVDHTDFFLIIGANPLASNGSIMTAAGIADRIKKIQKRGGRVVVVDPRRTETAKIADQHIFIRPGSDVLLLFAIVHTLLRDGLIQLGHLSEHIDNFDKLEAVVQKFTPEAVAGQTSISAETIRALATAFADAESAVCYGRVGVSMQSFGGLSQWLVNVINIVTGNFDRPGGAMFTKPAFDVIGITTMTGQVGHYGRWKSRVRGLPEFSGELPASAMAEEMLTPGDGQIRALITIAGNPVLSTPNGAQLERALANLDFMVAIDIYINETTRHAHIILPPTTGLETEHYDIAFQYLAVQNTAKFSEALFEPDPGQLHDWQIFKTLRDRLEGIDSAQMPRSAAKLDIFRRLDPARIVDLALRFGPYGAWGTGTPGSTINLNTLKRHIHGVDLGALQPCLPERLVTPGKRINLAPEIILSDLPRLEATMHSEQAVLSTDDLLLIGRRHLRSNNSWMHNSERLVRGKNRCTVMIHPQDAAVRGVTNGMMVEVMSRVGSVQIEAEITEDIMPGVVSIPHGWGHHRSGIRMDVAGKYAGVSINDLTDDQQIDSLTGNAAFSGVVVRLNALAQAGD